MYQDRIAGKPHVLHERKLDRTDDEQMKFVPKTSKIKTTTTITTSAKVFSTKKTITPDSSSLPQRVYEFEKTARYMIKKLQETRDKIEESLAVNADADTIEILKMSIAPDAATLISQGDSLVLETHGSLSTELANTVMDIQSILREKFREVQHAK